MRATHNKSAVTTFPIPKFDFSDPQRKCSDREEDYLWVNPQIKYAIHVFRILVRFRTVDKISYPYKYQLQRQCGLGSHHTLNKHLETLKAHRILDCRKFVTRDKFTKKFRVLWVYTFPMADFPAEACFWGELSEDCGAEPQAENAGYKSYGLINKNSDPELPVSFPQSTDFPADLLPPETDFDQDLDLDFADELPVASVPVFQTENSAVFLVNETEEKKPEQISAQPIATVEIEENYPEPEKETNLEPVTTQDQENNQPCSLDIPLPLELNEDREKSEKQIAAETQTIVNFVKKEKSDNLRVKTLGADVASLEKVYGLRSVLAGLKCLKESISTVFNPGGWLRVHLQNPVWLGRIVEKIEDRKLTETSHERAFLARKEKQAEEDRRMQDERLDRERVEQFMLTLPREEVERLTAEARGILEKGKGILTALAVRCQARLLVRARYFANDCIGGV